ncbi:MAG: tetratricopeptide repeat protein [Phycisphaerales bacterium]|nr:tetratricopeptide repeat protein [Phycisphaerales bacterium]
MSDTTVDYSVLFETMELTAEAIENFADQVHASLRERERFEELVAARAGQRTEPLRMALGYYLLDQFDKAITAISEAPDNRIRRFYQAKIELGLGRIDDAIKNFQRAAKHGWDEFDIDLHVVQAHVRAGDVASAAALLKKHAARGAENANWRYASGLVAEWSNDWQAALDHYDRALTLEPSHTQAMFRAARLLDLRGNEEEAVELYERLALQPRAQLNALLNLSVVYEDMGLYDEAIHCLQRVITSHPEHFRAHMFLKDCESSRQMVIDEGVERRADSRNRLLATPISELDLGVRTRNVLKKMGINTLGELLRVSEPELMAYKNFGDTSLQEIKNVLARRNLHLGQHPDEIDVASVAAAPPPTPKISVPPGSEAVLTKAVSELELSVRARRCLQRLNIVTLSDLIQKSESELLATRNFGQTSLTEIKSRLAEFGLSLATRG